jgi:ATP-binding protein involved in chromosome partitioning
MSRATSSSSSPLLLRLLQLRRSLASSSARHDAPQHHYHQQRAYAGCGGSASKRPGASAPPPPPPLPRGLRDVAAVVAVASGKGGVGKSTVAANVAVALAARHGLRVGLMDADIHGPSLPTLMNLSGKPPLQEEDSEEEEDGDDEAGGASRSRRQQQKPQPLMLPLENHGVRCMSMGFFTQADSPIVWRGPIVSSAIDRFLHGTAWGKLDVLIVDMPPGTGDAQITLGQRLPLDGALVVTTPQQVALLDARRGARMFEKVGVPVLGLVANMASFVCGGCGAEEAVFGSGEGVDGAARELGVSVLGRVPLEGAVSAQSDAGAPVVVSRPGSRAAAALAGVAAYVADGLTSGAIGRRRQRGAAGGGSGGPTITMAA